MGKMNKHCIACKKCFTDDGFVCSACALLCVSNLLKTEGGKEAIEERIKESKKLSIDDKIGEICNLGNRGEYRDCNDFWNAIYATIGFLVCDDTITFLHVYPNPHETAIWFFFDIYSEDQAQEIISECLNQRTDFLKTKIFKE